MAVAVAQQQRQRPQRWPRPSLLTSSCPRVCLSVRPSVRPSVRLFVFLLLDQRARQTVGRLTRRKSVAQQLALRRQRQLQLRRRWRRTRRQINRCAISTPLPDELVVAAVVVVVVIKTKLVSSQGSQLIAPRKHQLCSHTTTTTTTTSLPSSPNARRLHE